MPSPKITVEVDTYLGKTDQTVNEYVKSLEKMQKEADKIDLSGNISKEIQGAIDDLKHLKQEYSQTVKNLANEKLDSKAFDRFTQEIESKMDEITGRVGEAEQSLLDLQKTINDLDLGKLQNQFDSIKSSFKEFKQDTKTAMKMLKDFQKLTDQSYGGKQLKDITTTLRGLSKIDLSNLNTVETKKSVAVLNNELAKTYDDFLKIQKVLNDKNSSPKMIKNAEDQIAKLIPNLEQNIRELASKKKISLDDIFSGKSNFDVNGISIGKVFKLDKIAEDLESGLIDIKKRLISRKDEIQKEVDALASTSGDTFTFKDGGIKIPVVLDERSKNKIEDSLNEFIAKLSKNTEKNPIDVSLRLFPLKTSKEEAKEVDKHIKDIRAQIPKLEDKDLSEGLTNLINDLEKEYQKALILKIKVAFSDEVADVERKIELIKQAAKKANVEINPIFTVTPEEMKHLQEQLDKLEDDFGINFDKSLTKMADSLNRLLNADKVKLWSDAFNVGLEGIQTKLKDMEGLIKPLAQLYNGMTKKKETPGRPSKEFLESKTSIDKFTETMELLNKALADRQKAPKLNAAEFTMDIQNAIDAANIPVQVPVEPNVEGFIQQLESQIGVLPINIGIGGVSSDGNINITTGSGTTINTKVDNGDVKGTTDSKTVANEVPKRTPLEQTKVDLRKIVGEEYLKNEFKNVDFNKPSSQIPEIEQEAIKKFNQIYNSYINHWDQILKNSEKLEDAEAEALRQQKNEYAQKAIFNMSNQYPFLQGITSRNGKKYNAALNKYLEGQGIERTQIEKSKDKRSKAEIKATDEFWSAYRKQTKLMRRIEELNNSRPKMGDMKKEDENYEKEYERKQKEINTRVDEANETLRKLMEDNPILSKRTSMNMGKGAQDKLLEEYLYSKGISKTGKISDRVYIERLSDAIAAKGDFALTSNKKTGIDKATAKQNKADLEKYVRQYIGYKAMGGALSIDDIIENTKARSKFKKKFSDITGIEDFSTKPTLAEEFEKYIRENKYSSTSSKDLRKEISDLTEEKNKILEKPAEEFVKNTLSDMTEAGKIANKIAEAKGRITKLTKEAKELDAKGLTEAPEGLSEKELRKLGFEINESGYPIDAKSKRIAIEAAKSLINQYGLSDETFNNIDSKGAARLGIEALANVRKKKKTDPIDKEIRDLTNELFLREKEEEEEAQRAIEEIKKKNASRKKKNTSKKATTKTENTSDTKAETAAVKENTTEVEKNTQVKKENKKQSDISTAKSNTKNETKDIQQQNKELDENIQKKKEAYAAAVEKGFDHKKKQLAENDINFKLNSNNGKENLKTLADWYTNEYKGKGGTRSVKDLTDNVSLQQKLSKAIGETTTAVKEQADTKKADTKPVVEQKEIENVQRANAEYERRQQILANISSLKKEGKIDFGDLSEGELQRLFSDTMEMVDLKNKTVSEGVEYFTTILNNYKRASKMPEPSFIQNDTQKIKEESQALEENTQKQKENKKAKQENDSNPFQGIIDRINKYGEEKVKISELKEIYEEYAELVNKYGKDTIDHISPIQDFLINQLDKQGYKFDERANDAFKVGKNGNWIMTPAARKGFGLKKNPELAENIGANWIMMDLEKPDKDYEDLIKISSVRKSNIQVIEEESQALEKNTQKQKENKKAKQENNSNKNNLSSGTTTPSQIDAITQAEDRMGNEAQEATVQAKQGLAEMREEAEKTEDKIVTMYRAFNSEHGVSGIGVSWFSDDLQTAASYFDDIEYGNKDSLAKLSTDISKFLSIDAKGQDFRAINYNGKIYNTQGLARMAKDLGYAGLELKNVFDSNTDVLKSNIYAIFDENIVKKAENVTQELKPQLEELNKLWQHFISSMSERADGRSTDVWRKMGVEFQNIVDEYSSGSITIEQAFDRISQSQQSILEADNKNFNFRNKVRDLWKSLSRQSDNFNASYAGYGKNDVWKQTLSEFLNGTIEEEEALKRLEIEFRRVLDLSNETPVSSKETDSELSITEKQIEALKKEQDAILETVDAKNRDKLSTQELIDASEKLLAINNAIYKLGGSNDVSSHMKVDDLENYLEFNRYVGKYTKVKGKGKGKNYWYNESDVLENEASAKPISPAPVGERFGEEYIQGILSKVSETREAAAKLPENAEDATAKAQKSKSPSKVAEALGEYWGEGYAQGIRKHKGEVEEAVRELVRTGILTAEDLQKDFNTLISGGFGKNYKALAEPLANVLLETKDKEKTKQQATAKGQMSRLINKLDNSESLPFGFIDEADKKFNEWTQKAEQLGVDTESFKKAYKEARSKFVLDEEDIDKKSEAKYEVKDDNPSVPSDPKEKKKYINNLLKEQKGYYSEVLKYEKELSLAQANQNNELAEHYRNQLSEAQSLYDNTTKQVNALVDENTIQKQSLELSKLRKKNEDEIAEIVAKRISSEKKKKDDQAQKQYLKEAEERNKQKDAEEKEAQKIREAEKKHAAQVQAENEKANKAEINALTKKYDIEEKEAQKAEEARKKRVAQVQAENERASRAEIEALIRKYDNQEKEAQKEQDKRTKTYQGLQGKLESSAYDLQFEIGNGKHTETFTAELRNNLQEIENLINSIDAKGVDAVTESDLNQARDLLETVRQIRKQGKLTENRTANENSVQKGLAQINSMLSGNTKLAFKRTDVYKDLISLQDTFKNFDTSRPQSELSELTTKLLQTKARFEDLDNTVKGKNLFQTFIERLHGTTAQLIAQYLSWMDIIRYIRTMASTLIDLDTQLVDLRKTTSMTTSELNQFYNASSDVAKELGVTTSEIISQASAWSRLGYSTREASTEMAKLSSKFASVSPGMTTEQSTDYLVSTMQAYGIAVDDVERKIMDNVNRIGNTFATTNAEIGEMLTRSSAAMNAANNSLEETIALESAAVEVTRNAQLTGTAFRTVSMRIRGLDEETEEALEGYEELKGKIADLTKTKDTPGGVSLFTDATKTEYKSTYQFLKDIAAVYDEISDKNQAALLEAIGGKRGAQSLAPILSNFDEVERAMREMEGAAGSADKEMDIIRDKHNCLYVQRCA